VVALHKLKIRSGLMDMAETGRRLVYERDGWEMDIARRELRARGVSVPLGRVDKFEPVSG
jgi:hypothetical protein